MFENNVNSIKNNFNKRRVTIKKANYQNKKTFVFLSIQKYGLKLWINN